MAGETTQGHAVWITVGAGAVLAGLGVIVTNSLASSPNRLWHRIGVFLIVAGILTMAAALCHQFRYKLLRRLLMLGLRQQAYSEGVPRTEVIFHDADTGRAWQFGEIYDLKEAEKRRLAQQRPDVWRAYRGRLFRDLILPTEIRSPSDAVPESSAPQKPADPNAPILLDGFEFYPDRNHLPGTRRTRAQMEKAEDEICASWNTEQLVLRGEMLKTRNRKRILLPHPEKIAPYLAALEVTATEATIANHIKQLTQLAWKTAEEEHLDVEVRWLTRMPRNTVMLCDPQRNHGWAHVELLQPGVPEDLRPVLWFTKSRFPILYAHLLAAFNKQWAHESVDPTWKAYCEVVGDRVLLNLTARRPMIIQGARVTVTAPDTPDGALLPQAAQERLSELQEDRSAVWFEYPRQFDGAYAAKSGEWHVRWSVLISGAWREATYATHDICIPREGS